MYKFKNITPTLLDSVELEEGETLETKVERILANKEPIKDGAPMIYTERKDGISAGNNIKTDRWEVACEAMDLVNRSRIAKRDNLPAQEGKVIEMKTDGKPESTQGEQTQKTS